MGPVSLPQLPKGPGRRRFHLWAPTPKMNQEWDTKRFKGVSSEPQKGVTVVLIFRVLGSSGKMAVQNYSGLATCLRGYDVAELEPPHKGGWAEIPT